MYMKLTRNNEERRSVMERKPESRRCFWHLRKAKVSTQRQQRKVRCHSREARNHQQMYMRADGIERLKKWNLKSQCLKKRTPANYWEYVCVVRASKGLVWYFDNNVMWRIDAGIRARLRGNITIYGWKRKYEAEAPLEIKRENAL